MTNPLKVTHDIATAEHAPTSAPRAECEGHLHADRKNTAQIGKSKGIDALPVEPTISIHLPEPKRVDLRLRPPLPARRKQRVEQALLRRYSATRPITGSPSTSDIDPVSDANAP